MSRLNRLRTGVGRFGANVLRWGLSTRDSCDCGAEQTGDHITSGRRPFYHPPEGINYLTDLNDNTRPWVENNPLDIRVVSRQKKKNKAHKIVHYIYVSPTSVISQMSPTLKAGILSSRGMACHESTAVYPRSMIFFPTHWNLSWPTSNVAVVCR